MDSSPEERQFAGDAHAVLASAAGESIGRSATRMRLTVAGHRQAARPRLPERCRRAAGGTAARCAARSGHAQLDRLLTLTLETMPPDATHWSTRAMAQRSGPIQSTASRIWRDFALKPYSRATSRISKNPHRHRWALPENPPDHTLVLAAHEESQIQAPAPSGRGAILSRGRGAFRARAGSTSAAEPSRAFRRPDPGVPASPAPLACPTRAAPPGPQTARRAAASCRTPTGRP